MAVRGSTSYFLCSTGYQTEKPGRRCQQIFIRFMPLLRVNADKYPAQLCNYNFIFSK